MYMTMDGKKWEIISMIDYTFTNIKIEDIEQTLTKLEISLYNETEQLRSFDEIFSDLTEKWETT